jgi:tetratricopeptide (TPR) repeat protein
LATPLLACASPPRGIATAPAPDPQLTATLVGLGDDALAKGDAVRARQRFERALVAEPASPAARVGLGRALLAEGRRDEARVALEAGAAANPDDADAHLALADVAAQDGDAARARSELERVLALDPARIDAHQRLAERSGPAPTAPPSGPDDASARGDAHPYDPRARLLAGEALLARAAAEPAGSSAAEPSGSSDLELARAHLEFALALSDLDPASGQRAAALLHEHFDDWRARRIVPVHAYADEVLRVDPAWRFQLRLAWLAVSQALDPLLGVSFVVVDQGAFQSAGAGLDLGPIIASGLRQHPEAPTSGVVFFATGRPIPRAAGSWQRGQAALLGNVLGVRLAPGEIASRVLAHEVMHLFGAIHLNPEVESLMNPSGDSFVVDPWNAAIVRATRVRSFGPGGIEANVLSRVDRSATIAAYAAAFGTNVTLRNAGIVAALDANQGSARAAAPQARSAVQLDAHLGDVADLIAHLLLRDGQPAAAVRAWETAAALYGPDSTQGRRAQRNALAVMRGAR